MKALFLGLCCGMLLAISAIANERPQNIKFNALDHNGVGGVSIGELQIAQKKKRYLFNINADSKIAASETLKF
jgi:hypothetical protein